jgi:hypothetical protein
MEHFKKQRYFDAALAIHMICGHITYLLLKIKVLECFIFINNSL